MIDGALARFLIAAAALLTLTVLAGSSIVIGKAQAVNDHRTVSRYSAQFVFCVLFEIILIVALAAA